LEQRNKGNRQKTKFQTSTCAKQETPKNKCKTYAKPKIPKKKQKKIEPQAKLANCWFQQLFIKKNTAAAQLLG
jgi:hypothetical protein